ncbi:MAG: S8 family serine peptidase [Bacteriovorax sp.]|nr:S8 family serine peptidase [Bacteriovorax sp.]
MRLTLLLSLVSLTTIALGADNLVITDPLFSKQWALKNNGQVILKNISDLERVRVEGIAGNDINWIDTSGVATTKKELIVAVLDSGMDINHPDLVGRVWYNEKLCANAPNAKILACNGFNFLDGNNNVADDVGHGTHVAGVISANRNSIGIAGAADARIKIMPIKVLNSQVSGFVYNGKLITDVIADAMVFAIKNGAEVINLSLGWPKLIDTAKIRQAFQMAEDQNVIVIAASGNNNKDLPTFPCAYENVVCVGAIDNRGELTDFSNHGSKVDLVAPGEYIISTIPRNLESRVLRISNYEVKRGSSQAAPYVTAAVATLKLLNPGLSNDKVRSLLFKSTRPLAKSKNNRFVKFGALDMKKLLSLAQAPEETAFLNPQIKAITEIKYRLADRHFNFNLPLKNLSDLDYNGIVCVNSSTDAISLDQNCFEVKDLKAHTTSILSINGNLIDLSKDSHIKFTVQVDQNLFQTSLVFSRDLNGDGELKAEVITGGNFDDMGIITPDRKISKMIRVIDKFHRLNYPEYFYLEKSKQTPTTTVASLLTNENGHYVVKNITLPLVNRVLSIHRQDLNLDGVVDTFIYALSAKKDELLFFNLDKNLNPLFGKYSKWSMTLSTFEGLPIDGGAEKFEWFKLNHPQLGSILVPSIYKSYAMPEADNSKNILDRVTTADNHQYYLNPKLQSTDDTMRIELRVIDSIAAMKKMRTDFHLYSDQTLSLLKPFPQTNEQSSKGEIHSLATLDNGDQKSYLELTLSADGIQTKSLTNSTGLENALIYPVVNSADGKVTSESILTSLLNRSGAEFLLKNDTGVLAPLVLRQDWENPIIGLIGGFDNNGEKNYLVENRSTISFLTTKGVRSDLPVYRDSSFPGQNFSETLMPILSEGRPGVFINSTLIYGERLYSMIGTDEGLIRPLRLSIGIPQGCVPLNPEALEEKSNYNYTFLCVDQNKQTFLKFLPMLSH